MSTRANIEIKDGFGDSLFFYCHSDGYPSGFSVLQFAQLLMDQNLRSVNARYREINGGDEYIIGPDDLRPFLHRDIQELNPLQVIKSCRCLDYQSCETENYQDTETARIIRTIIDEATGELPGYESLAWGGPGE